MTFWVAFLTHVLLRPHMITRAVKNGHWNEFQLVYCNHVGEVFVFMQISVHESRFDVIVPKPALTGSTTGYRLTVVETIVRQ